MYPRRVQVPVKVDRGTFIILRMMSHARDS